MVFKYPGLDHGAREPRSDPYPFLVGSLVQECQRLEEKCQEERGLGQEFAEEAQEWVKLTGKLSDRVNTLTVEAEEITSLRKVG